MKSSRYIPASDAERAMWLNNFILKLNLYYLQLGMSATEMSALQDDNSMFQYVIHALESCRRSVLNLTSYKNMLIHADGQQHIGTVPVLLPLGNLPGFVPEGIFDRITNLVTRIRHSPGYNHHIGADLGIIATSHSFDKNNLQPHLSIRLNVNRPQIKWVKGVAKALDLYADRNDGQGFVCLGRFIKNTYLDTAKLSVKDYDDWSYKAIYIMDDAPVGLYSEVISIVVKKA